MGAQDKEEILQAIDVLGGLLLEMNRRVNEHQTAQAEAFEEVTRSNETTKARLNALSEQVIALSDQMGVAGKGGAANGPPSNEERSLSVTCSSPRLGLVSPMNGGGSTPGSSDPRDSVLRQQSARARTAFRAMIAERDMGGHI